MSRSTVQIAVGVALVVCALGSMIAVRFLRAEADRVARAERTAAEARVRAEPPAVAMDPDTRALEVFTWIGGPGFTLRREAEAAWGSLADCQHVPVRDFVSCVDSQVGEVERLAGVIRSAEIPEELAETYDAVALANEELACLMRADVAWANVNAGRVERARTAADWLDWRGELTEAELDVHAACYRPGDDRPSAGQILVWLNGRFTYRPAHHPPSVRGSCWSLERVREVVEAGRSPDPTPCRDE